MNPIRTLAGATYGEITRRPLYYILLITFAVAIWLSKLLTLFAFYQEMNLVREMGMATATFWALIVILITSGTVVTQELEDRTAVTLLSKPIRRLDFLLGKYFGIILSIVPGMFILACILVFTLWSMQGPKLDLNDADLLRAGEEGGGAWSASWSTIWDQFLRQQGGVVFEGAILSWLQAAILASICVSLSALLPMVVSVAVTTLVFILGNISSYMISSVEQTGSGVLLALMRVFASVLPNLGYFNLQAGYSEGRIISFEYMGLASVYAVLYVSAIFLVSCSLFRNREIR